MFKKGYKRTLESRLKQRQTVCGRKRGPISEEWRKKLVMSHLGLTRSKESCLKQAKTLTGRKRKPFTEEHKKHICEARKKQKMKPCSEETRRKIGEANKGKTPSVEARKMRSIAQIKNFNLIKTFKNTDIEKKIAKELTERGIIYKQNEPIQNIANVDFFIPKGNIIIECDGDFWHKLPGIPEKDATKTHKLTELGYQVFRFWGSEIHQSPKMCVDKVFSDRPF